VLIARPDGSDGEIVNVIGEVPPDAVTGVKLVATALAVMVCDAITKLVEREAETVIEKVLVALPAAESVTVTVYTVAELVTVGVPVIAPVELLIDSPEGRPGEIA
jgi:hypothetical protein